MRKKRMIFVVCVVMAARIGAILGYRFMSIVAIIILVIAFVCSVVAAIISLIYISSD